MYIEFFGLRELPFNNTPDPRFFYPTPDHEEALASLIYAVQERKGFVLLTGEVGAGKTLVARMMLRHFGPRLSFATINHGVHGATDLMQTVCAEFELSTDPGMTPAQLVHVLQTFLLDRFAENVPVALLLDEAQNLPLDAMEQLRMVGNLEADDAKLLQVVIIGQPELRQRFLSANFRQLKQRIFRSFHLSAMNKETTVGYIRHRLSIAGAGDRQIFDDGAISAIHTYAQGLPRIVNTLCDNAMLIAYSADKPQVDASVINNVIEQMMMDDPVHAHEPAPGPRKRAPHASRRHGPHPRGRLESNTAPGALDQLVRRVTDEIEARLGERLAASTSTVMTEHLHAGPTAQPAVNPAADAQRPAGIERVLNTLTERVAALERSADRTGPSVARADAVLARLEPMLRRAATALQDVARATTELTRRETRAQALSKQLRSLLMETSARVDAVKDATADAERAQREVREVSGKLASQTARAQSLEEEVRPLVSRLSTLAAGAMASARVRPAHEMIHRTGATATPRAHAAKGVSLERLMSHTTRSLADLRTLVRRDGDCDQTGQDPSTPEGGAVLLIPPSSGGGLESHIEDLLVMIDAGSPKRDTSGHEPETERQ